MYSQAYSYYKAIYSSLPNLHRGSGNYILLGLLYFGLSFLAWPITIIFCTLNLLAKRKPDRITEVISGSTHSKISNICNFEKTFKIGLEIYDRVNIEKHISNKLLFGYSIIFAPIISWEFLFKKQEEIIKLNDIRFIKLIVLRYTLYKDLLNSKVLIQYNDHTPYNVMLTKMAQNMGVKTVYIQHAPIGYHFPPLHNDFNVLFSQDSLEKYEHIENQKIPQEKYYLSCDLRLYPVRNGGEKTHSDERGVLICINKLDDLKKVQATYDKLMESNYNVILRPHPEDKRSFTTFEFVSKNRELWIDLYHVKYVVVNESAVPLEAAFMNKLVFKAAHWSETLDNYNFLKFGFLTVSFNQDDSLLEAINANKLCYDKTKLSYYLGDYLNIENQIKRIRTKIYSL